MTESNGPGQPGQENSPDELNQPPADPVLANVPGAGTAAQREGVADEAFIRALYAEHGGALLRYALHLTGGDRQRAEDLVQETIVRAWRHPEALTDRPARPWLFAEALASLRPDHRKVIVETYYRGCSVAEAAATLGIPPGTVKSRTFYALKALKLALQERGLAP